jgi:ferritin-like protein
MANPTDTGLNRTGLQTSPEDAKALLSGVQQPPERMPGDRLELAQIRLSYIRDADVIGTVPPPGSMKGLLTTAKEMLKGNKPTVFIDKLGERLAFERSGVRLYDALITKFDGLEPWDGGPSRGELEEIRTEELAHFELVHDAIERLGADPTAMTPSADLVGVMSGGVLKVIVDPRTTLPEALQAMLVAERADIDGWSLLIELAEGAGQDGLAEQFRHAHGREERHAAKVKGWVAVATRADMGRELGATQH